MGLGRSPVSRSAIRPASSAVRVSLRFPLPASSSGPAGLPFGLPSGDERMVSSITVTVNTFFRTVRLHHSRRGGRGRDSRNGWSQNSEQVIGTQAPQPTTVAGHDAGGGVQREALDERRQRRPSLGPREQRRRRCRRRRVQRLQQPVDTSAQRDRRRASARRGPRSRPGRRRWRRAAAPPARAPNWSRCSLCGGSLPRAETSILLLLCSSCAPLSLLVLPRSSWSGRRPACLCLVSVVLRRLYGHCMYRLLNTDHVPDVSLGSAQGECQRHQARHHLRRGADGLR